MLSENAIDRVKSIIESNTDNKNIITEINLVNDFSECIEMGKTMSAENIFFNSSYNAFVCLRDFTNKETFSVFDEADFEEHIETFKIGDVYIIDDDDEFYSYYCTINTDDIQVITNETKEPLQVVNIFERCQGVLGNCDNKKEIWEKVKKMIDIYFE